MITQREMLIRICDPETGDVEFITNKVMDVHICEFCGRVTPMDKALGSEQHQRLIEHMDPQYCGAHNDSMARVYELNRYQKRAFAELLEA